MQENARVETLDANRSEPLRHKLLTYRGRRLVPRAFLGFW